MVQTLEKALEVYTTGTEAWFPDEAEGWIMGKLTERNVTGESVKMAFHIDALNKNVTFESTIAKLTANKFADLPPLNNPPALDGDDDLANLSYLHEAAVLHKIRTRYLDQNTIYTYSGIVLIAMNPFARLSLYGPEIMRGYSGQRRDQLDPHLFAVAEEAYRNMIKDNKNQSIIVSGESGAGKTQSARYIMRYFATVDDLSKSRAAGGDSEIEQAVMATNPIMESFGNSKTTRNDNSSRFGKYMEILFSDPTPQNPSVRITGAKIRTYLLERSRLIFQPATERNYHIFYQLCAGAPAAERKELGLGSWDSFFYLNQGGTGVVPNVDDAAEFVETSKALSDIGISLKTQWFIFKICAALLHIGNIKVTATRDEANIADDDPALVQVVKLLGVNPTLFKKWIVKKQIITRSEKIVTGLNQYQAIVGRDSIAKFIYSMLFDWLVKVINNNLSKDGKAGQRFIGVLDIYGFEHFKKNSFEQFCINYANEKLQQEFNAHVFKLEQEEYVREKINWSFIDFNDNQPCIDMIENKLGILDLLDEESRLPSGSDNSLITKLYQRFGVPTAKFFEKPRFGQQAFTIKHYANDVVYDIDGFIEKNKDTVSDEQMAVLNESEFEFLKDVIKVEEEAPKAEATPPRPGRGGPGTAKKPTLGSIFKASLVNLMETIRLTEAHYIRCIKPNSAKVAFQLEPQMVLQQLRACGVLETIRISCAGYPSKSYFEDFADRYTILIHSKERVEDPKATTLNIVSKILVDEDKFQMGLTKVFFRAGQLAFLEKKRKQKLDEVATFIQSKVRRRLAHLHYQRTKSAAIKIQWAVRRWIKRRRAQERRNLDAAIVIQAQIRRYLARRRFLFIRQSIIKMQCAFRVSKAKAQLTQLRRQSAATTIQKLWRGYVVRKAYKKSRKLIVLAQSCIRRYQAKKKLTALRLEAKSVGKLKEIKVELTNKVIELSQQKESLAAENAKLTEKLGKVEEQLASWKEKFSKVDSSSKAMTAELGQGSAEMKKEMAALQETIDTLTRDGEKSAALLKKRDEAILVLEEAAVASKEEIRRLKESAKVSAKNVEDPALVASLKKEVASLREQMGRLLTGKYARPEASSSTSPTAVGEAAAVGYALASSPSAPTGASVATSVASTVPSGTSRQIEVDIAAATARRTRRPSIESAIVPPSPSSPDRRKGVRASVIIDTGAPAPQTRSVRILEDKALEEEIIDALVTNLRIPLPSTQTVATRKEIFFPAHLIGTTMTQLVGHDLSPRMQSVMANVMKAIQTLTMKFEDDYVSAFWLSNCYELLCVVKTAQEKESREQGRRRQQAGRRGSMDASESERALEKVRNDLDYLLIEIYHGWIKELKKRLANMIVPAVIENQSLPGYICKQSGGLWGKWGKASAGSQFTIEQLLNFLSKLSKTMRCYYMEDSMTRQILTELLRVIGVSAFNHLLMRKNFCTWKRGVQIQYNVSRLEEWCTSHGIAEATLHLQQLLQAAKLLTLNKTSPQDIETIFDVCFLLNPTQIKKLLSLYYAADFDSPLSPELLKIVASRAVLNEKSDVLLLDLEQSPDFAKPSPRGVDTIEKFVPAWMSLPQISAVVAALGH
ncbi:P-loop containing nucleoside triphosphate hydrolase protein [Blyttiomyces helicus]|uniref:P-loop containing nucleoside triphosphate hydrolase protein n=1 Tax=Blyttiomyces helicus TaxID=388810 RepID=A0A4P9WJK2_9FUNG|nr:P-loop containing nucleoside triphosphate hydrolase protein [Blyttiomyces helicus]|eukprot:RKO93119.1 P-loop containing nucleoside triphosphate hydrolase protein [Blyttiomyces helicus]